MIEGKVRKFLVVTCRWGIRFYFWIVIVRWVQFYGLKITGVEGGYSVI